MIKDLSKNLAEFNRNNQTLKIAIVRSNYHKDLTESLEKACKDYLMASGVKVNNIKTFEVPGSWEIPLVAQRIAASKKFDGIAALGVILKGETFHFELIANACSQALMDVALKFHIPIAFEILAVYNLTQAKQRSTDKHNKGIEAAKTLLDTIKTLSNL